MHDLDRFENDAVPELKISDTTIQFGSITLLNTYKKSITVKNIGRVLTRFKFASTNPDGSTSKPWLVVHPQGGVCLPGDAITINLSLSIDPISARHINFNGIEDILVIHVENGKDHFVSISGNWNSSAFGNSIDVLCMIPKSVYSITTEECKKLQLAMKLEPIINQTKPEESSITPLLLSSIPKEAWRLVDFIFKYGLVVVICIIYYLI